MIWPWVRVTANFWSLWLQRAGDGVEKVPGSILEAWLAAHTEFEGDRLRHR